jgi:hypothetical protein
MYDGWRDDVKRIRDSQRGWGKRGFLDFDGETNLSPELEFAVSTLIRFCYRDFDVWEVHIIYAFAPEGIKRRIYVQDPHAEIRLTSEEAIVIATNLANKHLEQEEKEGS